MTEESHIDVRENSSRRFSENELRERWIQRLNDSLGRLTEVNPRTEGNRIGELLQQSASNGNSERALAGDHETRELLELLQNARDAIRKGRTRGDTPGASASGGSDLLAGKVHVSVHDTGLLVANTGAPFDVLDEEVEEAVCMVGESSKQGIDYIGSKGVGLKSILASGEAVEFWTTLEENSPGKREGLPTDTDADGSNGTSTEPFRVRLSRAYTTTAIYKSLGIAPDHSEGVFEDCLADLRAMNDAIGALDVSSDDSQTHLDELFTERTGQNGTDLSDLNEKVRNRISKQPLFYFPIELSSGNTSDPLAQRARALVSGEGPAASDLDEELLGAFRTAVFIEYTDDDWRTLLPDLPEATRKDVFVGNDPNNEEGTTGAKSRSGSHDIAEQLWNQLTGSNGQEGLQPETLVHLGEIDELTADRIRSDAVSGTRETEGTQTTPTTRVRWEIDPPRADRDPTQFESGVRHQRLRVNRTVATNSKNEEADTAVFDLFDRVDGYFPESKIDDEETPEPRVLIPLQQDGTELEQLGTYPLNLFYPIENTTQLGLPFCLHGRFRVQTNRKDLSPSESAHNEWVLKEAATLIGDIAELTAQSEGFAPVYPWALLPPPPNSTADRQRMSAVLTEFITEVYRQLRTSNCFPQESGTPTMPTEALFHWDSRVNNGFQAFYSVSSAADKQWWVSDAPESLPAKTLLNGFLRFDEQLEERVELLLTEGDGGSDEATWTDTITDNWLDILARASIDDSIQCEAEIARTFFGGLVQLLVRDESFDDDDIKSTLDDHKGLSGSPLLPCLFGSSSEKVGIGQDHSTTAQRTLQLVPVESHQQRKERASRTVLWNIDRSEEATDLETPPAGAGFSVYFLDPGSERLQGATRLLNNVGRLWGIRNHNNDPQSYYRSLVQSFATEGGSLTINSTALAFLANQVENITAQDLSADEAGFIPKQYLRKALEAGSSTQRSRLRRRLAVRKSSLEIESPSLRGASIREFAFDDMWQRRRKSVESNPDNADEADGVENSGNGEPPAGDEAWGEYTPPFSRVLPAPSCDTWNPVYEQIHTEGEKQQQALAQALSLLGVSTFADLNVLWRFDDEHPDTDDNSNPHWSPLEWIATDESPFDEGPPETVTELNLTLESCPAYLDIVSGPGHHPAQTVDHSSTCAGWLATGSRAGGTLGSWVWLETTEPLVDRPADATEAICRHDDKLTSSILWTGWTCNGGSHQRYTWEEPVPTLLNWQLRSLPIWESELTSTAHLPDGWGTDKHTLRWALPETEHDSATAEDLFPTVDTDSNLSSALREALGVKPIADLTPIEAADRLQKLLDVFTDQSLAESREDHVLLQVGSHDQRWQSAYSQLITRLLHHFETVQSDDDSPVGSVTDSDILTHFPMLYRGEWFAVNLDKLSNAKRDVRCFETRSPKFWEKDEAHNQDVYILKRTRTGPFKALRTYFDADVIDAQPPHVDQAHIHTDPENGELLEAVQTELKDRREVLIAAMERTNTKEIKDTYEQLTTAFEQLAIADSAHFEQTAGLRDGTGQLHRSGIYELEGSEKTGIVLNGDVPKEVATNARSSHSANRELNASDAARGISLLVRRPSKLREFEHALRHDRDALQTEYEERFPLQKVQAVLGTKYAREFQQKYAALDTLLESLSVNGVRPGGSTFLPSNSDQTDDYVDYLTAVFCGEEVEVDQPGDMQEEVSDQAIAVREHVPEWAQFVLKGLFDSNVSASYSWWCEKLEGVPIDADRQSVIRWLANHEMQFDLYRLSAAKTRCENLVEVAEVVSEYEPEQRSDVAEWRTHIEEEDKQIAWHKQIQMAPLWDSTLTPSEWFYYADKNTLETELLDPLVNTLVEAVDPGEKEAVKSLVETYVFENELPQRETRTAVKERQQRAFDTLGENLGTVWDRVDAEWTGEAKGWDASLDVTRGSSGTGGSSGTPTGRAQQAEAFTMVHVIRRLSEWIEQDSSKANQLIRGFQALRDEQFSLADGAPPFKWHLQTQWGELESNLNTSGEELAKSLTPEHLQETPLSDFSVTQLINITQEQGPGFDVIDPFGPLTEDALDTNGRLRAKRSPAENGSTFAPVEVKAVRGDPPYSFRLTTNELRRCRAFLDAKNRLDSGREEKVHLSTGSDYVIRLVKAPSAESEWESSITFARPDIVMTEDQLKTLFTGDPLEFSVKGGYVNMHMG